jgi:hypothetical protein
MPNIDPDSSSARLTSADVAARDLALCELAREWRRQMETSPDAVGARLTSFDAIYAALQRTPMNETVDHRSISVREAVRELAPPVASDRDAPHIPEWVPQRRAGRGRSWMLQAAAAAVVAAVGAWVGRVTAPVGPSVVGVGQPVAATDVRIDASGMAIYPSVQHATLALSSAQQQYERAALWLAANDTGATNRDVYRARLAALDQMMAASRAALRDAPQDPLLNHYFLSAYTARETTLQQLGITLPVDKTVERY